MKSEENTTALAVKENNALSTQVADLSEWGTGGVTAKDVIIPRILLMQPMSEKVTAGESKFGEFRDSLNNELIGGFDNPFAIIPFHMEKVFVEYDCTNPDEKEFLRVVPITPANENLPYEDQEKGEDGKMIQITRDRTMNFYVLLPSEMALGTAIPYILSFRRSSLQAGKKLATQMYMKNMAAGLNPAAVTCVVSAGKQTEDKKTWAVMDVKPASSTSQEHQLQAFKWLSTVKAGKAKAHEASYTEEAKVDSKPGVAVEVDVEQGPAKF